MRVDSDDISHDWAAVTQGSAEDYRLWNQLVWFAAEKKSISCQASRRSSQVDGVWQCADYWFILSQAPEIIKDNKHSTKSDVYSFGMVLLMPWYIFTRAGSMGNRARGDALVWLHPQTGVIWEISHWYLAWLTAFQGDRSCIARNETKRKIFQEFWTAWFDNAVLLSAARR